MTWVTVHPIVDAFGTPYRVIVKREHAECDIMKVLLTGEF